MQLTAGSIATIAMTHHANVKDVTYGKQKMSMM